MNADRLAQIPTIREFFRIEEKGLQEGVRLFLEAMEEVTLFAGTDIVSYGAACDDGMYIILEGKADVFSKDGDKINELSEGDFIGELGLINDDVRNATVRAASEVRCANISKELFDDIVSGNRKIFGFFMSMLYTKTTKLVREQERIKSELAIATQIQMDCLENDFSEFNGLPQVHITAHTRPAKEVGGDFYDVFMTDENHLYFLIADVSGKGIPAALFMTMAKTHIKNFATVGLPLAEVVARANEQLCYKNEAGMFVTAFICVLDLRTNEVTFVNAGHNRPFLCKKDGLFCMLEAKVNLVLGMMENIPYREQTFTLESGDRLFLYTDGVTEAWNPRQEMLGEARLHDMLNRHVQQADDVERFVSDMYGEVDVFAEGEQQSDDITMLYISRNT